MKYCSLQDIEAYYLGKKFECDSWITSHEVDTFISQEAAYMNALLRIRYHLPITDGEDLMLLKTINENLVVGKIDGIVREKSADQEFERGRNPRKEAIDLLGRIENGTMSLITAQKDSAIRFNSKDSNGDVVVKRFRDSDNETGSIFIDRERHAINWVP